MPQTARVRIWSAGRELEVIDGERRLLDKPEMGKIHRVELVVRKLPAVQEFRTFACGRVFGDLGNQLRHGEQSDRRQRSLFAIVAIAGWIEAFMKVRAADEYDEQGAVVGLELMGVRRAVENGGELQLTWPPAQVAASTLLEAIAA